MDFAFCGTSLAAGLFIQNELKVKYGLQERTGYGRFPLLAISLKEILKHYKKQQSQENTYL